MHAVLVVACPRAVAHVCRAIVKTITTFAVIAHQGSFDPQVAIKDERAMTLVVGPTICSSEILIPLYGFAGRKLVAVATVLICRTVLQADIKGIPTQGDETEAIAAMACHCRWQRPR